jgi:hypothetical protein
MTSFQAVWTLDQPVGQLGVNSEQQRLGSDSFQVLGEPLVEPWKHDSDVLSTKRDRWLRLFVALTWYVYSVLFRHATVEVLSTSSAFRACNRLAAFFALQCFLYLS